MGTFDYLKSLTKISGNVKDSSKLVLFLYMLMRNMLSVGQVESLIRCVINDIDKKDGYYEFPDGYLAKDAQFMANVLSNTKEVKDDVVNELNSLLQYLEEKQLGNCNQPRPINEEVFDYCYTKITNLKIKLLCCK